MARLLVLLFLLSCVPAPAYAPVQIEPPATPWRLEDRPVSLLLPTGLPPACVQALEQAVMWWAARGAGYVLVRSWDSPDGPGGRVTVLPDLPKPGHRGETYQIRNSGHLVAAYVRLAECSPVVARHELGHALGLSHDPEIDNVMYYAPVLGTDLNPEQVEAVR